MGSSQVFNYQQDGATLILQMGSDDVSFAEEQMFVEMSEIIDHFDTTGLKNVVVDFKQISYFGSMFLETLLQLWKQVEAVEGTMALCNLSDVADELVRIPNLDTFWPIYATRSDALQAISK